VTMGRRVRWVAAARALGAEGSRIDPPPDARDRDIVKKRRGMRERVDRSGELILSGFLSDCVDCKLC